MILVPVAAVVLIIILYLAGQIDWQQPLFWLAVACVAVPLLRKGGAKLMDWMWPDRK